MDIYLFIFLLIFYMVGLLSSSVIQRHRVLTEKGQFTIILFNFHIGIVKTLLNPSLW